MQRYDASKDINLSNTQKLAIDRQFFVGHYRKRKFISDENVLFDRNDDNETIKNVSGIFGCNKMNYFGICDMYHSLFRCVTKFIFSHGIKFCNQHEAKNQICIQLIDDLQWEIASNYFGLLQNDVKPTLDNGELCKLILSRERAASAMAMGLTLVSVRYGLLITDLCSEFHCVDIAQCIDGCDGILYRPFLHYSDFDEHENHHVLYEDECLHRKRIIDFVKKSYAHIEISRLEASAVKKSLKSISSESFRSDSILIRRAGLWIWDQCDNPLNEKKMAKMIAISEISKKWSGRKYVGDGLKRVLHRAYAVTQESIVSGTIIPIGN